MTLQAQCRILYRVVDARKKEENQEMQTFAPRGMEANRSQDFLEGRAI